MAAQPPSASVTVKDAVKLGLTTKFISNIWGFDENLLQLLGDAGNERMYGMSPVAMYGANVAGMKPILEFNQKNSPDAVHTVRYIQGWTAMMVMWEGLKRADKAGQLNGPGLKAALETLKDFDTGDLTPAITYTPTDHRPAMSATIYKMSQGKLVPVKKVVHRQGGPLSRLVMMMKRRMAQSINQLADSRRQRAAVTNNEARKRAQGIRRNTQVF